MARLTISLPEDLATAAAAHAATQKRSASAYVSLLIEANLQAAGLLPTAQSAEFAETLAKVSDLLTRKPALKPALEKFLRDAQRPSKARCLSPAAA